MNMTLAVILGICAFLAAPLPSSSYPLPLQATQVQQNSDKSSQTPAPQEKEPQEQPAQQPPSAETKSQEPAKPEAPQEQPSQPAPAQPAPAAQPAPEPPVQAPPPKPSEKKAPAKQTSRKSKHGKKRATHTADAPKKVIIRNGGTAEPNTQLTPGMSEAQANHSRQTTRQLLESAEANLKLAAARTLSSNQQAMLEQTHAYIEQANAALKEGDFQRGHNLAMKARLLSDELVRR